MLQFPNESEVRHVCGEVSTSETERRRGRRRRRKWDGGDVRDRGAQHNEIVEGRNSFNEEIRNNTIKSLRFHQVLWHCAVARTHPPTDRHTVTLTHTSTDRWVEQDVSVPRAVQTLSVFVILSVQCSLPAVSPCTGHS